MGPSLILLDLAGNVALLLWGLYMVQSGVSRAFGTDIRRYLSIALRNRFKAFAAGLAATTVLQSSTATGMMAASFTSSRMVALVPALALMLGANVGTTLIVQVLSFDINKVAPIIVLLGVFIFKRSSKTSWRDGARAIIGLGLMLFSLEHMLVLLQPAEESQSIKLLLSTISQDHVLNLLFGALLTWAMHSSVAVVLIAVSFASQGLLPLDVAFSIVLGANLGSALNPLLESPTGGNPASRRLPVGNLINRLVGCLIFLPLLGFVDKIPAEYTTYPAQAVAGFHTAFNVVMAIIFLPILPVIASFLQKHFPDKVATVDLSQPLYLDPKATATPHLALANASREALRMADVAEKMLHGTMDLFAVGDRKRIHELGLMEDVMDKLNHHIKLYITSIRAEAMDDADQRRASEILAFSMNMEHIADVIGNNLAKLGAKKIERKVVFSIEGWAEIRIMLERVTNNVRLACAVFMSRSLSSAKQLMNEKGIMRDLEMEATEMHFKRLREGRPESVETSAMHLDIVRDLKRINSHITSVSIPALEEHGQLLKSRMKLD